VLLTRFSPHSIVDQSTFSSGESSQNIEILTMTCL